MTHVDKIGPAVTAERAERLKGWREDIETIKQAVWEIHHHRFVWREMRATLVEKSPDETIFLDHYDRLYAQGQLIAVRRLVDSHRDSVSLTRLLTDLAEHPETMTRRDHVDLWKVSQDPQDVRDEWRLKEANAAFDKYANGDGDNVDLAAIRRDLDQWRTVAGKIKKVVDKRIAHFEELDESKVPQATYKDLDEAIDEVGAFLGKYTTLLTASWIADMDPHIQSDWKRPFRQGLFESFSKA